ncbi:MAG: excinuclease ABC subunit UvrC [Anaerolineae bacterium]|nr:excinuclease ABC subunit UvrC [Anaerolineae bacterium]MBL8107397.1 excinuclease ABC subunit UvrC [Anaerolineales bacterium]MCC7189154.1 excinuclease ABC subunit UvrC [Anaerolineales bacterium]
MDISEKLQGILDTLPAKPGCYLMKNADGAIIYVGKAISLKNRVRSYFHADASHDAKTRRLARDIVDIEWIVVGSELEALILEMNLIKKHRPRYNIRLKDDKRYPYIKVRWAEPYPKVTVTRQMVEDGSRYFGPYTSAWAVYQTLDILRKIFPYLTCDREITGQDKRACLYYDIKLCIAPCIGAASQASYRQMISDLMDFLSGHSEDIVARLQTEMEKAATEMRYEKAAAIRNQLKAIQSIIERQKIVFATDYKDSDVLAMARSDGEACVQVFFIRSGKLIGREYFILEGTEDSADAQIMEQFVTQFYTEAANIPQQVMLPQEIEEAKIIGEWLRSKRGGGKVEFIVPKDGQPSELVKMAAENATETLTALRAQWQADAHKQEQALAELQQALNLKEPPNRIECYDISNTQGTAIIGAMVVFTQGVADKKLYRKFNIESVVGAPDDFASMEEMLTRRFRRWRSAEESASQVGAKKDASFSFLPDLVIIDGGKGQLGRAVEVLEKYELMEKIPIVGLAKQQEEIFFPHKSDSLMLPRHSQALYLVQRIRDEAHRYGITAHRKKRQKIGMASILDAIPEIGPARRKSLLKHFGSVDKIRAASLEELCSIVPESAAQSIKAHLE